jgi:hypothetical protein
VGSSSAPMRCPTYHILALDTAIEASLEGGRGGAGLSQER